MDSSLFTWNPEFPLTKPPTEAKSLGSGTGAVFPELGVQKVINWVISVIIDFGVGSAGKVRGIVRRVLFYGGEFTPLTLSRFLFVEETMEFQVRARDRLPDCALI